MKNLERAQIQPHNIDAEMAVLGCMLIEKSAIALASEILSAADFYKESHKTIFSAIVGLSADSKAVDLITLVEKLRSEGTLEAIGGAAYLAGLGNAIPSAANIEQYARIVKEKSVKRLLIAKLSQIETDAYESEESAEAVLQRAGQVIVEISEKCAAGPRSEEVPAPLDAFLKSEIPPVEYFIEPILPVNGKLMISACSNVGKSIFVMNLCLAMTTGMTRIFDKWDVKPARVLYVDLEMGESPMRDRFAMMCGSKNLSSGTLFVKSLPCLNLLDAVESQALKKWLKDLNADVLVLDPLGHAWAGNENSAEDVIAVTRELNKIIAEFNVSIVLVHHWRKATKDFKEGGQMAAGSYRWEAWLDSHITLKGESDEIHVTCEKNRHAVRFKPWVGRINEESLWVEHIADHGGKEKKLSAETFGWLFDSAMALQDGSLTPLEGVPVKEIVRLAQEQKICSRFTITRFLEQSRGYALSGTSKGKSGLVKRIGKGGLDA